MFQENSAKRSPMQIVGIIVIFILAVLIVCTFVIFGIFKDSGSAPKLFGSRVYVVTNDLMSPRIPKGAAVFVEEGTLPDPSSQSVILCNIDGGLYVIGYVGTSTTESGETSYIVRYDNATDDRTWGISQNDIIGVAKSYDKFVGAVIRFASSKAGMMTIVIIPCALVIIYEVLMLVLSRGRSGKKTSRREPETVPVKPVQSKEKTPAHRVSLAPVDDEDIPPEREDIGVPVNPVVEERFVEKQLRRANDKLNTTVLETSGVVEAPEINLSPLNFEPEPIIRSAEPEISPKPAEEKKPEPEIPSLSIDDLSPSRIDELIKLLEEEKKRLGDK